MKLTGLSDLALPGRFTHDKIPSASPGLLQAPPVSVGDVVNLSNPGTWIEARAGAEVSAPSTPLPRPTTARGVDSLARDVGVHMGPSGALMMLEGTPLIGAGLLPDVPQQFTKDAVDKYYLGADENSLSPAGKALYAQVRGHYLDPVPECTIGSPTIYCTGGLPGSGKGSVVDSMVDHRPDFVLVDPDKIKQDIIEDLATKNPNLRAQMQNDREWGTAVHWTSSIMARELMVEAIKSGKDIVFDSSMSTPDQGKYREFANDARAQGYRVNAMICNVDVDKSIERAEKRSKKPVIVDLPDGPLALPGRLVTADYVRECDQRLHANLNAYLTEGLFDNLVFFDNSRDGEALRFEKSYRRVAGPGGAYSSQAGPG